MKPESQRIAIAEACGWRVENGFLTSDRPVTTVVHPKGYVVYSYEGANKPLCPDHVWLKIPDYLADLNAMHEAEKVLTVDEGKLMIRGLWKLVAHYPTLAYSDDAAFLLMHATAAQRAEAFLRTLGKWEDA